MPDFKKMNENEIRSYIRESESDIEEIEHKYHKEIEYESEQEAQIEREYFQLQNLLDSANSDPKLQGILCEGLDVISNIRQRRFELMDDLHNDKNWIAFERKLLTVWCIYRKGYHNIPINKRNGRKQAQHLKIARFARDLNYEDENGWRKGNGRNPKKEIVLEWRKNG